MGLSPWGQGMSSPFLTRSPTNVNVLMSQLKAFDGLLKKHNVCFGQKLQWWKQHFWKVYLVQLHFVEILHRRYWMGKHWEQGAFCTGPVDVWVWSQALPGAQKATGTDPLGLPSYTSLRGQADSGLLPGSTKNKIKSVTLKLQLNFGIQTKNISNKIHMSKRVWSSIQFLYVHVHLHALPNKFFPGHST